VSRHIRGARQELLYWSLVLFYLAMLGSLVVDRMHGQEAWLKERDRLRAEMLSQRSAGNLTDALTVAERVLWIERRVLGSGNEDVAGTLESLADMREERGEFAPAREARKQVLQIRTRLKGADYWRSTDARLALANCELLERLGGDERKLLRRASALNREFDELYRKGKFAEAVTQAKGALEIRQKLLGEEHAEYATDLNNLALLYDSMGDYTKAEPLYHNALEIRKQALGENHPDYAQSLNNLAGLYESIGYYAKAEPLYRKALEIRKQALGEKHRVLPARVQETVFR
jgi:tetratricopeptide (TPR) repeat protein